jgi:hypothetical protein
MLNRGDRHQRQLAGGKPASKADRVTLIGRHPIRRTTIGPRRGAHRDRDPRRQRVTRQPIPGPASYTARAGRASPRSHGSSTAGARPPASSTPRPFPDRRSRSCPVRVHVQTDPADTVSHVSTSS